MALSLQLLSEQGHAVRIKNTFIDITPKNGGSRRSPSCPAKLLSSEFDSTLATTGPLIAAEQLALRSTRVLMSSDGSEPVSPATKRDKRDSVSTTWSDSEALKAIRRDSVLTTSSTTTTSASSTSIQSSDEDEGHEDFLKERICRYLTKTDNSGQTLMWHGLSTKFQVRPHLLNILQKCQAKDVGYIYLPQNIWEKKGKPVGKVRNKGYAFIHFTTEAAASDFQRTAGFDCTTAALQGISANLAMLVSAPQKRTIDASVYLPNNMDELERVPIHALRDLCGKMRK
jgi:hypothetical protein